MKMFLKFLPIDLCTDMQLLFNSCGGTISLSLALCICDVAEVNRIFICLPNNGTKKNASTYKPNVYDFILGA